MPSFLTDNRYKYTINEFLLLESEMKENAEFVFKCLKKNGLLMEVVNERFKNDMKFISAAIENDPEAFEFIPLHFRDNENFIIELLNIKPGIYLNFSDDLLCRKKIVLEGKILRI